MNTTNNKMEFDIDTNTTPVYDYEIVQSPPVVELVSVSITYGATLLIGIIGNGLVIFSVSRYEQMMTITNLFLLSLASADLMLVLFCVPVKFAAFFSYSWTFGEFLCKAIHYMQNVSAICSVLTLTVMSLERYYAIAHPMKAKSVCTKGRAWRAIIALWMMSFVLAVPILIGRVYLPVGINQKATWCVKWFATYVTRQLYEMYMFCIILVIPVIIMTVAYTKICKELVVVTRYRTSLRTASTSKSGTTSRWQSQSNGNTPVLKLKLTDLDSTKRQVIKMLVAIVLLFVICWLPIHINDILISFQILPELHQPPYKYIREAFHLMSYINSCVNPIVYGFMSRNFRHTFTRAVCRCIRKRQLQFKRHWCTVKEKWKVNLCTRQTEVISIEELEMGCRDKSTRSSKDAVRL